MKDTLRVLLGWKCNLACAYCCNRLPEIREQIVPRALEEIDFAPYSCVCITGGEPLLYPESLVKVLDRASGKRVVLYTNGVLLTKDIASALERRGLTHISVGLHDPTMFDALVAKGRSIAGSTGLKVRFCLEDRRADYLLSLRIQGANVEFKFWHMDDCDRENEDRVILKEAV